MTINPGREIALDTETTGLNPKSGHRIIEVGCVELINRLPTGNSYHIYINPEREVPYEAYKVHGISTDFLEDKPKFHQIADDFLDFIGNDLLIIHNAAFDIGFLNHELAKVKKRKIEMLRVKDTLAVARSKFPGSPANLDALCKRYNIDISKRTKHGALLDAELLAEVYIELTGGRQTTLGLSVENQVTKEKKEREKIPKPVQKTNYDSKRHKIVLQASPKEIEAHKKLIETLNAPIWEKIPESV